VIIADVHGTGELFLSADQRRPQIGYIVQRNILISSWTRSWNPDKGYVLCFLVLGSAVTDDVPRQLRELNLQ